MQDASIQAKMFYEHCRCSGIRAYGRVKAVRTGKIYHSEDCPCHALYTFPDNLIESERNNPRIRIALPSQCVVAPKRQEARTWYAPLVLVWDPPAEILPLRY